LSYSRVTETPIHHVFAEMAAYPLASPASLANPLVALMPRICDEAGRQLEDEPTARLWRDAEQLLLRTGSAFSVEEIVALRDELWFDLRTDDDLPIPVTGTALYTPIPLSRYARQLADRCINCRGPQPKPRSPFRSRPHNRQDVDAAEVAARRDWRWLTFALPADFLLAAHRDWDGRAARVDLLSPWLRRRMQDQGYAQSHVHMKGDFDFAILWARIADVIDSIQDPRDVGSSPGADFLEGRHFGDWLIRALLARLVLAAYLRTTPAAPPASADFTRCRDARRNPFRAFVYGAVRQAFFQAGASSTFQALVDALQELGRGELEMPSSTSAPVASQGWDDPGGGATRRSIVAWAELQTAYKILRESVGGYPRPLRRRLRLRHLYSNDPLASYFPASGIDSAGPEMQFIHAAVDAMERREAKPSTAFAEDDAGVGRADVLDFDRLFWQTTRIRNLVYRHVTQRPQTPGLQWFLRFYARIKGALGERLDTEVYVESAAHYDGFDHGLTSLEVRTGIESTPPEVLQEIDKIIRGWKSVERNGACEVAGVAPLSDREEDWFECREDVDARVAVPARPRCGDVRRREFGIVFHFSRDRGGGALQGVPNLGWRQSNADPQRQLQAYRFAAYYRTARAEALALGEALRIRPELLFWVRGIDVCTDELGVPSWVFKPLVRYVRDCAKQARSHLRRYARFDVDALRTTIHAGEDFVHLLTGLRNLDETIEHFSLCAGDRIGHGLALGVAAERWSAKANRVPMPIECRLRDLVWELNWYRRNNAEPRSGRWHWVEEEVLRLTKVAFGMPVAWQVLHDAWELLLDESKLGTLLGFPDAAASVADDARNLHHVTVAYRYLTDFQLFADAHRVVWVDHLAEAAIVEQLQHELRAKVCRRGLTIEVNPTSNLLVGDFHDLTHHPLWRLKPPRPIDDLPPVALCIGSDDPLNFATTLPEEFQFVLDAAVLAGLSCDDAQSWFDEVRQSGLDCRFTAPPPADPEVLARMFPVVDDPPEPPP
jgi:hypothetical protein